MMKKLCFVLGLMLMLSALALAAPVDMKVPPEAIETPQEGTLETYGLVFPEEMPPAARNFFYYI